MGKFGELTEKMSQVNSKAIQDEKMALLLRYGVDVAIFSTTSMGKWIFMEEGSFGKTTLKLYKLVESVEIELETKVRAVVTPLVEPEDK